jgi:hypothetical protein
MSLVNVEIIAHGNKDALDSSCAGFTVPRSKDKLMLQGTQFWWCLGVYNEEMKIGHKLLVDVDAWSDMENAGSSDELDHSVSLYG